MVDVPGRSPDACSVPPAGWECSREGGHEGPCAARATTRGPEVDPSAVACKLRQWRDNLEMTQGSPIAGDCLHGSALDFVLEQVNSILDAWLPKAEPKPIDVDALIAALRAPAYWMSGSTLGHDGVNGAPYEAAKALAEQQAMIVPLTAWLALAVAEMSRARGRLEIIGTCNEDRRIAAALGRACDSAITALRGPK